MPNVHSVSDITSILSVIIRNEPAFQNVRVEGKVSVDGPPNVFFLNHVEKKIRCFIPGGKIALFNPLLTSGNTVVVNGKIAPFSSFSQYQILVNTIEELGSVGKQGSQPISVSKITSNLQSTIKTADSLKNIHVQGKISANDRDGIFALRDAVNTTTDNLPEIKCVPSGVELPPVQLGDEVCLRGKISIYPQKSLYQVDIGSMELVPSSDNKAQCQCSGCEQCLPLLGNNHQCNRFPNPLLCPKCYAANPNSENKVVKTVDLYFSSKKFQGFSTKKECEIQFGSRNGNADVVLVYQNGSFAAIVECKGAWYTGHGIEQLKSYLSATDTRFGIFANRADPKHWKFYENRRRNRFYQINRFEFERGVVEGITNRERLRGEIANLNSEIAGLENQKSELHTAIGQVSQTKRNLIECTSNLTQQIETLENYKSELHEEIHRKLDNLLEEKMPRLERPLSELKIELQKRGIVNWFKNLFSKENK